MGSMPAPLISSADLRSMPRYTPMLHRRLALMGSGISLFVLAVPLAAQTETVMIEQINRIVFPADGSSAARDICTGLKAGVLSRDQIGTALAKVQQALDRYADRTYVTSYVTDFNRAAASISGCNVQVTGPDNSNLNRWSF